MKRNIYCYCAPIEPLQWPHHSPIFNILPLIFNSLSFLLISLLIVILFLTFPLPFTFFISSLPSILISLFPYPYIFLYFLFFLFPSSYYKFTILSHLIHSFPTHKCIIKIVYKNIMLFYYIT